MILYTGDCLDIMPTLDAESVHSIVTDPPYGLSFMGKDWDHGVPGEHFWREALRVAKPGAHLLAFGGTRTFHRLAVAIEDAGWEIRDTVMWVYGSGFPKSLDVSKAIDKAAGAEREVVGTYESFRPNSHADTKYSGNLHTNGSITAPATDAARQWDGWGTALKPAVEYIVVAQKPLDLRGLCVTLAHKIGECVCQLRSLASHVGNGSLSSQSGHGGASDSALWLAVPPFNTPGDLFAAMDTWPSGLAMPSSLSIALSWLDILGAIWTAANTFTTETASSLTTDLRILNSSPSKITAESIAEAATGQPGIGSSASLAASIFNVASAKLESILTPFAAGLVTSKDGSAGLRPEWRPIIVARKPLCGTVAENVLKHGTGGINVDWCRVKGSKPNTTRGAGGRNGRYAPIAAQGRIVDDGLGRWPANVIHDGSDEVVGLFPQTSASKSTPRNNGEFKSVAKGRELPHVTHGHDDNGGSAARFFYCAKASKADRDEGCADVAPQQRDESRKQGDPGGDNPRNRGAQPRVNHHPTVKPTALMRYLVKLVTPPGGVVLDPFTGSGSTGKAAILEGFDFVGIELDREYMEIARARIAHAQRTREGMLF